MSWILGISAFYHDSAAVLLHDGEIVYALQEERFSRKRHDPDFPEQAIRYCLSKAGIRLQDLDAVAFYDKPLLKFERLLETHLATVPFSLPAFIRSMPVWLQEKLYLKQLLRKRLCQIGACKTDELPALLFSTHHQAHAASAYYGSGFQEAAILCLDGVGEWAASSAWQGSGASLQPLWQQNFPHSIGLLYSAFTYYAGFRVNSGEYKLMGLAPYGRPVYVDVIKQHLLDLKPDGSFHLNMRYFDFAAGLRMTSKHFHRLFGAPPRAPESEIRQRDMDIACSIQKVIEEIILRLARHLQQTTGARKLCLAGGVALNCVANGLLRRQNLFEEIWVQPAADDAGGALGVAWLAWHHVMQQPLPHGNSQPDRMQAALLGSAYSDDEIEDLLRRCNANYQRFEEDDLISQTADELDAQKVVGWFQGRMEFGPRALGSRSILGDPRSTQMQATINLKIKYRESFRPFAPAVLREKQSQWFEMTQASPYMLFVTRLQQQHCVDIPSNSQQSLQERLQQPRSQVPAITHVDYSARVQTVEKGNSNPRFRRLLEAFDRLSNCPMLVNTSFNVRGEPIVESPVDALRCFMRTEMDVLVLGSCVLHKHRQPDTLQAGLDQLYAEKQQARQTNVTAAPSRRDLRLFAINTGLAVILLFAWLFPWMGGGEFRTDIAAVAALWITVGILLPDRLAPLQRRWLRFGAWLGRFTSPLVLSLLYFILVLPSGLLMRLLGNDPLQRKPMPAAASYLQKSTPLPPENMEKPF